jgi:small subunit ribosomal protein S11
MAASTHVRQKIATIFRHRSKSMARPRPDCFVTINCTLNNTHVCFATTAGKVITTSSAGAVGFVGPERSSREGAMEAARVASERAKEKGFGIVKIRLKGGTTAQSSAISSVLAAGFKVVTLEDITGFPTNGCRPRKTRRL